jgi:hypothetical protein
MDFLILITDFMPSWLFIIDIDSAFWPLHHVDVGSADDVS